METGKDIDAVLAHLASLDAKLDTHLEKIKQSRWTPIIVGGALVLAFFLGLVVQGRCLGMAEETTLGERRVRIDFMCLARLLFM